MKQIVIVFPDDLKRKTYLSLSFLANCYPKTQNKYFYTRYVFKQAIRAKITSHTFKLVHTIYIMYRVLIN